jgi:hypothetical protein
MIQGVIVRQALSACASKSGIDVVRHFPSAKRRPNTGSFLRRRTCRSNISRPSLSSRKSTEGWAGDVVVMVRAVQVASGAAARTGRALETASPRTGNLLSRGRRRLGGFEVIGPSRGVDHELAPNRASAEESSPAGDRLVAAATWWPRADGAHRPALGRGAYYILGTSLATGQGYRLLSEPAIPRAACMRRLSRRWWRRTRRSCRPPTRWWSAMRCG